MTAPTQTKPAETKPTRRTSKLAAWAACDWTLIMIVGWVALPFALVWRSARSRRAR